MVKIRRVSFLGILITILLLFACNKREIEESKEVEAFNDTLITQTSEDSLYIEPKEEFREQATSPLLAVIIDDFGNYNNFMLNSLLDKFSTLPEEVAFAILPDLNYSQFVMEYFQFQNRELLLHTPMQAQNLKANAGEVVINDDDDAITIINKLNRFYEQLPLVKGINNHMGSKVTANSEAMITILEWCKSNNLYFVDSATTPYSVGEEIALQIGVPTASRDIFLDVPNSSQKTIDNYLLKMQKHFKNKQNILVITHASSLRKRDNLLYFIQESLKMGFELVPVSEYLTYPEEEEELYTEL